MSSCEVDPSFWLEKKVFITGHSGFKGGWLSIWLSLMGAKITGYSLPPLSSPNLFNSADIAALCDNSHTADIRDLEKLQKTISLAKPEIIIHMAAQSLVRQSYINPVETYSSNVMGTVNVLESARSCESVRAVLVITSDKCYENKEWIWGYRENDAMGGYDPYSSSKGCAELVVNSYKSSFFNEKDYSRHQVAVATARAGNVIGGGDWSKDRLIPDAIAALMKGRTLIVRNPKAIRPWQHVLEPLSGYLVLTQMLYKNGSIFNGGWNFGPSENDSRTVEEVIELLISSWGGASSWRLDPNVQPHEANFLKLDCSKAAIKLGWKSKSNLENVVQGIVEWHKLHHSGISAYELCKNQIQSYI